MHILLANDDGIQAAGIRQLCLAAAEAGHRVSVAAPDQERSGFSHAFTYDRALRVRKVDMEGATLAYAINGVPVDCAKLGLYLLQEAGTPADFVISGINQGHNMGSACIYSGTVNAAIDAAMCGYPALASSLDSFTDHDFRAAARITVKVAEWAARHPLKNGEAYNLNVPAIPYEQIKGIRPATLAPQFLNPPRYKRIDCPLGGEYYWLHDIITEEFDDPEYDVMQVRAGYATLTPLSWDMRVPNPYTIDIQL